MLRPFLFSAVVYLALALLLGLALAISLVGGVSLPVGIRPAHVHLALLGSISQAMLGAIPFFAVALLATLPPDPRLVRRQWWLANLGTLAVAIGFLAGWPALTFAGGLALLIAVIIVAYIVHRMMGRSLIGRRLDVWYYFMASVYGLIGMALGLILVAWGSDASFPRAALRLAHLHVTLIGWVSLTIIGTMYTFFPTIAGTRAGSSRLFTLTFWLLAPGVAALATGNALNFSPLTIVGGLTIANGAVIFFADVLRARRATGPLPLAGAHLYSAALYFLVAVFGGLTLLGLSLLGWVIDGRWLIAYAHLGVVGWIVQTLIGAMVHLMPVMAGGGQRAAAGPTATVEARYADWRGVMQRQGAAQFWLFNGGLLLFSLALVASPSIDRWPVPMLAGALALIASLALFAVKVARLYAAIRIRGGA